jgi:hypothetical protein
LRSIYAPDVVDGLVVGGPKSDVYTLGGVLKYMAALPSEFLASPVGDVSRTILL